MKLFFDSFETLVVRSLFGTDASKEEEERTSNEMGEEMAAISQLRSFNIFLFVFFPISVPAKFPFLRNRSTIERNFLRTSPRATFVLLSLSKAQSFIFFREKKNPPTLRAFFRLASVDVDVVENILAIKIVHRISISVSLGLGWRKRAFLDFDIIQRKEKQLEKRF